MKYASSNFYHQQWPVLYILLFQLNTFSIAKRLGLNQFHTGAIFKNLRIYSKKINIYVRRTSLTKTKTMVYCLSVKKFVWAMRNILRYKIWQTQCKILNFVSIFLKQQQQLLGLNSIFLKDDTSSVIFNFRSYDLTKFRIWPCEWKIYIGHLLKVF